MSAALRQRIEDLWPQDSPDRAAARAAVDELLTELESGTVRAAEPDGDVWRVNTWVKRGLLLGFRVGVDEATHLPPFHFSDRDTFPTVDPGGLGRGIRVVPGGSTVRRGAYLGAGVVIMPPAYVNVGAWVGESTMVDSHALVGSCAQIGSRVHLSAAAQIGGVLEPVGASPVVVEDDAFVGGGCGIYEGTRVGRGAVLAPGVTLSRSVPIYDLVAGEIYRGGPAGAPTVPDGAVVVPGSRAASGALAEREGLQLYAAVIVKYRDASTDAAAALEEALR